MLFFTLGSSERLKDDIFNAYFKNKHNCFFDMAFVSQNSNIYL